MSESDPSPAHTRTGVEALLTEASAELAGGRAWAAEIKYRQVLGLDPGHAAALNALGVLKLQTGRLADALELLHRATQQPPESPEHWNNFGVALRQAGQLADAADAHRRAIALSPQDPHGHTLLGLALRDARNWDEAEQAARTAVALRPGDALLHNNLGTVLMHARRLDGAAEAFRKSLELQPNSVKALNNLGTTLLWAGRTRDAIEAYDRALALNPNYAQVHWHRSTALLALGDWDRGWAEYEWRWACPEYRPLAYRPARPLWDGSDPVGKTILLTPEQGLGDTIQFVRYVPLLAARGARVILLCQPELVRLLRDIDGAAMVVPAVAGATPDASGGRPLPPELRDSPFDVHLPLLSLPHRFGTTVSTVSSNVPCLRAEPEKVEAWRLRFAREENAARTTRRVGLVWATNRTFPDPGRSCGLDVLRSVGDAANALGIRLYSLQVGAAAADARRAPAGMTVIDLSADLNDFSDTAAAMANLDLVITIDTVTAHLAGALARPVWTILKHVAEWRWMTDREDFPWYPTMRLFRQPKPDDWHGLALRVAEELRQFTNVPPRRT